VQAAARRGEQPLRADVLRGGYRLVDHEQPDVILAACGAVMPEAVHAAQVLADEGVAARVLNITSPDRLHREWRIEVRDAARTGRRARTGTLHLAHLLAPGIPIVTIHDAASHALSWLGSVLGCRTVPIGVDAFGQSGSVEELYGVFDLLPGQIVNAALAAIS
jgi:pyruvate dehydrogenase E1 component